MVNFKSPPRAVFKSSRAARQACALTRVHARRSVLYNCFTYASCRRRWSHATSHAFLSATRLLRHTWRLWVLPCRRAASKGTSRQVSPHDRALA